MYVNNGACNLKACREQRKQNFCLNCELYTLYVYSSTHKYMEDENGEYQCSI